MFYEIFNYKYSYMHKLVTKNYVVYLWYKMVLQKQTSKD